jgi:hypothetical protein
MVGGVVDVCRDIKPIELKASQVLFFDLHPEG